MYKNLSREDFLKFAVKHKLYSNEKNLDQYLNTLFADIDFTGKSFLDIGGGNGLFTHYATYCGASRAVCMEPEDDGSTSGDTTLFTKFKDTFELQTSELVTSAFQEYESDPFDIVLSHNSINHLDEPACEALNESAAAREIYNDLFKKLSNLTKPGGQLIVCDCRRRNFFSDLKLTNPFMRTIEWKKHQEPEFWAEMLQPAGFESESIQWTTFNTLGPLAPRVLNNRLAGYMTLSHFRMYLRKT